MHKQLGGTPGRGTIRLAAAVAVVLAAPSMAAAQKVGDVLYESAGVPVWVVVEDIDGEAGAHRVRATVLWDDYRSGLRFAAEVLPGELMVTIPKSEDPAGAETCGYTSALMAHGSKYAHPMERADTECYAPPVEYLPWIAAEHRGSALACAEASRTDGTEDPAVRYFGCYFAEKPNGG